MKKKESETYKKIQELINSGKSNNISLAFQMGESQGIPKKELLKPWSKLISFLKKQRVYEIKRAKTPEEKILALFNLENFIINLSSNEPYHIHTELPPPDIELKNKDIPSAFWKLHHLKKVSLSRVELYEVPPQIEKMLGLQELFLNSCHLSSLPQGFSNLQNLKRLHLRDNKFTSLPSFLSTLQNINFLDLRQNCFSKEEKEKITIQFQHCTISWD